VRGAVVEARVDLSCLRQLTFTHKILQLPPRLFFSFGEAKFHALPGPSFRMYRFLPAAAAHFLVLEISGWLIGSWGCCWLLLGCWGSSSHSALGSRLKGLSSRLMQSNFFFSLDDTSREEDGSDDGRWRS